MHSVREQDWPTSIALFTFIKSFNFCPDFQKLLEEIYNPYLATFAELL